MEYKIFYRRRLPKAPQAKRQGLRQIRQGIKSLKKHPKPIEVGRAVWKITVGTQIAFGANRKRIMKVNFNISGKPGDTMVQISKRHTADEWLAIMWSYLDEFDVTSLTLRKFANQQKEHRKAVQKHYQMKAKRPRTNDVKAEFMQAVHHGGKRFNAKHRNFKYKNAKCVHHLKYPHVFKANLLIHKPSSVKRKIIYSVIYDTQKKTALLTDNVHDTSNTLVDIHHLSDLSSSVYVFLGQCQKHLKTVKA